MNRSIGLLTKVGRAVWNGPFHIGRLTRPVSLGDALLKVLETFWRAALIITLGTVSIVGIAILGAQVTEAAKPPERITLLKPTVVPFSTDCVRDFPILVAIQNDSKSVLNKVSFDFEARLPGRSTNLVKWSAGSVTDDTIIKPGEKVGMCWGMPEFSQALTSEELRSLVWTVQLQVATWAD